jgi:hypothetical protein
LEEETMSGAAAVFYLLCLIGLIVLQICLIVAVFRTSRATQDTAFLLRKMSKDLKYLADIEETREERLKSFQQ